MATSTVARTKASLLSGVLLVGLVSSQSVSPSNTSLPNLFTQLTLLGGGGSLFTQSAFNIAPLTTAVGLGQSQAAVNVRIPPLTAFGIQMVDVVCTGKPIYRNSPAGWSFESEQCLLQRHCVYQLRSKHRYLEHRPLPSCLDCRIINPEAAGYHNVQYLITGMQSHRQLSFYEHLFDDLGSGLSNVVA